MYDSENEIEAAQRRSRGISSREKNICEQRSKSLNEEKRLSAEKSRKDCVERDLRAKGEICRVV